MIASTLGFLARISRVIFGGSGPRSGLPGDDFKAVNVTLLDLLYGIASQDLSLYRNLKTYVSCGCLLLCHV